MLIVRIIKVSCQQPLIFHIRVKLHFFEIFSKTVTIKMDQTQFPVEMKWIYFFLQFKSGPFCPDCYVPVFSMLHFPVKLTVMKLPVTSTTKTLPQERLCWGSTWANGLITPPPSSNDHLLLIGGQILAVNIMNCWLCSCEGSLLGALGSWWQG